MPILLLSEKDEIDGPGLGQRWDRIVDLGRMPPSVYAAWIKQAGCPVESLYDHHIDFEDLYVPRELLATGRGAVVDRDGIDWWEMLFPLLERECEGLLLARRCASRAGTCDRLVATRPSLIAVALQQELKCPLQILRGSGLERARQRAAHYRGLLRDLRGWQMRQVLFDKFDATYAWRKRFASRPARSPEPVILLPSAYGNVSRTALAYARLLPQQKFLLVVARDHAAIRPLPGNVREVALAAYVGQDASTELESLTQQWHVLEQKLAAHPAWRTACDLGVIHRAASLLSWGVAVRDAWKNIFETQSVAGCLSGDDANPYTRLPLMLARQKEIPTVACHHGAFDSRLAYKAPDSDVYLAKGAMEEDYLLHVCGVDRNRVRVGAPESPMPAPAHSAAAPWLVFFSEPFEVGSWRAEAIYQEIMPRLCQVARAQRKHLVLKLHPFESAKHRRLILRRILSSEDLSLVTVVDAPMSPEILQRTWCAVAGVSTAAVDCVTAGIPTFLCGWLHLTYAGYAEQFAKFGVGRILEQPDDLRRMPELMASATPSAGLREKLIRPITSSELAALFPTPTGECQHA